LRLRQGRVAHGHNSQAVRHARASDGWQEKRAEIRSPVAKPLRLLPATWLRRAGRRLANLAGAQGLHGRTDVSKRASMPGRMAGLVATRGRGIERQPAE